MATNRKQVNQFILDSISFDGYDKPKPKTDADRILWAYQIACNEVGHILNERDKGPQDMIEYWFSGLCSVISLPYLYADIIPLAVKWGSLPEQHTEKQAERICENWFKYMAAQFLQMVDKARKEQDKIKT